MNKVEPMVVNFWLPYIRRYLKVNSLPLTKENVIKAFDYQNNIIGEDIGMKLKKIPQELVSEVMKRLNEN